jgi:hypothetical protein
LTIVRILKAGSAVWQFLEVAFAARKFSEQLSPPQANQNRRRCAVKIKVKYHSIKRG